MLGDLPQAVAVLERLGFQTVTDNGVELFVPPPEADSERTTVMHLASFAIFCKEEWTVMYTQNHPALPEARVEALLGMQAEEVGRDPVELAKTLVRRVAHPPAAARAAAPPLPAQAAPSGAAVAGHHSAHR
ncbi:hypothetical protein OG304_06650 [Streptomyces sp. NBC_00160]|uniref:hypothetical protein n=1 Tax=Streptomyces sp. NBC_00160 TaxID=2903628 RepID=UPI002256DCFC|nr:hypothetical protein [Streptomyces sp. NBC_00160]MCX5303131.1 hypothetical protein [Streptomyces sp. NBC_00160]